MSDISKLSPATTNGQILSNSLFSGNMIKFKAYPNAKMHGNIAVISFYLIIIKKYHSPSQSIRQVGDGTLANQPPF